jgi:hypothetical protein
LPKNRISTKETVGMTGMIQAYSSNV